LKKVRQVSIYLKYSK